MQRGDAPAEEICANHLNREPNNLKVVDPGDCNCELPILRVEVAPILATDYLLLPGQAERLRVFLLDPAPLGPPFFPLLAIETP